MIHLPRCGYVGDYTASTALDVLLEQWNEIRQKHLPRTQSAHILSLQGSDHIHPFPKLPEIIDILNAHFDEHFEQDSLENYIALIRQDRQRFPTIAGELRGGYRAAYLLQGVYSSRMYLKQHNDFCQTLLERYAEPLNACATLNGCNSNLPFLQLGWKYCLQNHPHDSICGCSVDPVHREMMTRFEKSMQISQGVISQSMNNLTIDDDLSEGRQQLVIFNPSPYLRSELIDCCIDIPQVNETFPVFAVVDPVQRAIPLQIIDHRPAFHLKYEKHRILQQTPTNRCRILLDVAALPALGFKNLSVNMDSTPPSADTDLKVGRFFMENKFLRVEISDNGMITVTNKTNGFVHHKINLFEDGADVGDEYNYSYPVNDEVFLSRHFKPRLSIIEQGPLRGAIRIRIRMKVPARATVDETGRSQEKEVLKISSIVYLEHNAPIVYFETKVQNTIFDHRLRVLFQTEVQTSESHAETAFGVIKRKHRYYDAADYTMEIPSATHPMQRFVSVIDREKGFTLLARGLPEYELKPDGQGTLALTLLRCVHKLSGDHLLTRPGGNAGPQLETPDAQCQGEHTFHYAIFPHGPDFESELKKIYDAAEWHHLKPYVWQNDHQAPESSMLTIAPASIRLSAFKEAEDGSGIVLHLYNPSNKTMQGVVKTGFRLGKVFQANLNEETQAEVLLIDDQRFEVTLRAWEIQSYKCVIEE